MFEKEHKCEQSKVAQWVIMKHDGVWRASMCFGDAISDIHFCPFCGEKLE